LRRAIQRLIEDPLADELLGGMMEGGTMLVDRDGDQMKITLTKGEAPEPEKVGAAAGAGDDPGDDSAEN
jgi:hypothetical protein